MSRLVPPPPPAGQRAADSLIEELLHARALSKSRRVIWLVTALLSTGTGAIGWIGSKVDTLHDMQAIREDLAAIRNAQDAQARAVRDLTGTEEAPGRLLRLERGQRYVWRALLEARTAARAGEPAKLRALKEREAKRLGDALVRRVDDGAVTPMAAYDEIAQAVAVP